MKRKKVLAAAGVILILALVFASPAFAIDESEVNSAISSSGKESVAGSIFIWFLCAIGFLKVSQKIDSFMASLGVNVGRTGGSMMAELLLAGRAVKSATNVFGGKSYSRNQGSSSRGGGSTGASGRTAGASVTGGHGVIGVAQRAIGRAAASAATGSGNGMRGHVGNAVFNSSLAKGGALATGVISSVALGSIAENGSITGARASDALTSYLGYHEGAGAQPVEGGAVESSVSSVPVSGSDAGPALSGSSFSGTRTVTEDGAIIHNSSAFDMDSGTDIPSGPAFASSAEAAPDAVPVSGSAPTYRNVEIGGGRITGYESVPGGSERQFAMYSTDQYMEPSGEYSVVKTVDGASWYKQYAEPTVKKTPRELSNGKITYDERIVLEMPQIPKRKDRV